MPFFLLYIMTILYQKIIRQQEKVYSGPSTRLDCMIMDHIFYGDIKKPGKNELRRVRKAKTRYCPIFLKLIFGTCLKHFTIHSHI